MLSGVTFCGSKRIGQLLARGLPGPCVVLKPGILEETALVLRCGPVLPQLERRGALKVTSTLPSGDAAQSWSAPAKALGPSPSTA